MYTAILIQTALTLVVTLVVGIFGSTAAAISAILGGTAIWLPNLLLALKLSLVRILCQDAGAAALLIGEFVKIVFTLAILATVASFYSELIWPAFLASAFVTLQGNWIALLVKDREVAK